MTLLQMSFSGTVMIVIIIVIRALTLYKLPKKTFPILWDVALMRLLIPYSVPSALSVYSLAGQWLPTAKEARAIPVISAVPVALPENVLTETTAFVPEPGAPAFSLDSWTVIWFLGAFLCGLFFATAYFRCQREFRTSLPIDKDYEKRWLQTHPLRRSVTIRQYDKISAPLTYGIFRPVILMPKTTDWTEEETLVYVLEHEYVHIRRLDAVTKLALTAALCIHWFNPMVWMMYVLGNRDMELSCDEAVIRRFGEHTKSAYAMTLLHMEEIKSGLSPLCNNFSKNAIEERIVAIMKIKKKSLVAVLAAIALIAGITTVFATSEQPVNETDKDDTVSTVMDEYTVTSYTDPADGKTYYSWDGGTTWTAMTEKEFQDISARNDVEWWTAEEYEAWLEQEKAELRTIIGDRCWTPSTGWFTWTQERVDEAIASYEQTLKDIRSGKKISKPTADGDTIQYGYDPDAESLVMEPQVSGKDTEKSDSQQIAPEKIAALTDDSSVTETPDGSVGYSVYEPYGLVYDEKNHYYTFSGNVVRFFNDPIAGASFTNFFSGTMDIEAAYDGDTLIGIKECSKEVYDRHTKKHSSMSSLTGETAAQVGGTSAQSWLKDYTDYGITYNAQDGNWYYNDQRIMVLVDGEQPAVYVNEEGSVCLAVSRNNNHHILAIKEISDTDAQLLLQNNQSVGEDYTIQN